MHTEMRFFSISLLLLSTVAVGFPHKTMAQDKIGVIYVVHGGMEIFRPQYMWDAVVHQFTYDHNHSVYQFVIWNSAQWGVMLDANVTGFAKRFLIMYEFGYGRVGGVDPAGGHMQNQLTDREASLADNTLGLEFEVDWAGDMSADDVSHFAYPRFVYSPPGPPYEPAWVTGNVTYCGEQEADNVLLDFSAGEVLTGATSGATASVDDVTVSAGSWGGAAAGYLDLSSVSGAFEDGELITGSAAGAAAAEGTTHWPDCDPERYNVDGPAERLLNLGVGRIIVVDATVGGVRFSKTYDVVEKIKLAVEDWTAANGGAEVPVDWVNDPNRLMERSYPTDPAGWTRIIKAPEVDPSVPLAGNPNPWIADMELALLHVEDIEAAFSGSVPDNLTAVALLNHALHDWNEYFDNAGFNLYRASSRGSEYTKINAPLIAAKGSAAGGASYRFIDNDVSNRKAYWYKLEDIDDNGKATLHGPVSATPRLIHGLPQPRPQQPLLF